MQGCAVSVIAVTTRCSAGKNYAPDGCFHQSLKIVLKNLSSFEGTSFRPASPGGLKIIPSEAPPGIYTSI
jgi:hypothetical protein